MSQALPFTLSFSSIIYSSLGHWSLGISILSMLASIRSLGITAFSLSRSFPTIFLAFINERSIAHNVKQDLFIRQDLWQLKLIFLDPFNVSSFTLSFSSYFSYISLKQIMLSIFMCLSLVASVNSSVNSIIYRSLGHWSFGFSYSFPNILFKLFIQLYIIDSFS